jgi:hypothetical protein
LRRKSVFDDIFTASAAATLVGVAGDDLYMINGSGVVVTEATDEGVDEVEWLGGSCEINSLEHPSKYQSW